MIRCDDAFRRSITTVLSGKACRTVAYRIADTIDAYTAVEASILADTAMINLVGARFARIAGLTATAESVDTVKTGTTIGTR
jgi:hypothetical protein